MEKKINSKVDIRCHFIPCTEGQVGEVCDLLDALGFKAVTTESREWTEVCNGVQVFPTKNYQAYANLSGYPTLSLEELRELAEPKKRKEVQALKKMPLTNVYIGHPITNPMDIIRLAHNGESVYNSRVLRTEPAAFVASQQFTEVCRGIRNNIYHFVIQ